ASRNVASEMTGIQAEVGKLVSSIRDIAEATHEQSVATNEMARAAEEVNRMTIETDQAVQGANRTVDELSGLSKGLYGLVERFRL
ncbi:MAG: methyl-accepting chemotaxis protein, partial [Propionivibrio sp.]